jgi:nitroimidazol reductase NimA-like FMN-containing flavoprotein (pyridoxamine 5'-phosphate oxidase superfamily)
MQQLAISILKGHGIMALATRRLDGWPQATMVGYVSDEFTLYFLISRTSQKFRNLSTDDRVSIAIGSDAADPKAITGLSMAAHASEVRDEPYRSKFCALLAGRHPQYFDPEQLDFKASALMRARPEIISIVDFSKGLGHSDVITLGSAEIVSMSPATPDSWGPMDQDRQAIGDKNSASALTAH